MTDLSTFRHRSNINDQGCYNYLLSELEKGKPFNIAEENAKQCFTAVEMPGGGILTPLQQFKDLLYDNVIDYEFEPATRSYKIGRFLPNTDETDENGAYIGTGSAMRPRGFITTQTR